MPGFPEHRIVRLAIAGVFLVDLEAHVDSRGFLYEAIHASDHFVPQIRQVYVVGSPRSDTIRAFHAHEWLHDWFHIAQGSALFCLVDGRADGESYRTTVRLALNYRYPQLLVVPPGVFHGWMSLEPDTLMVSIASEEYDRANLDERRVPPDHFNDLFGGNPWRVDAR